MKHPYNRTVDDWEAIADSLINYLTANIDDINSLREEDGQDLIEASDIEAVFRLGVNAKRRVKVKDWDGPQERELIVANSSGSPGLEITFPGYGTATVDGDDSTIFVEFKDGIPSVCLWPDIEEEEPILTSSST